MLTYRAILRPRSATRSPWQADTLFGHLCWLIRYEEGAPALEDLLARCRRGAPPLLLSDGFPDGWLPRPQLPTSRPARGLTWVGLAAFEALRRGAADVATRTGLALDRTVLKRRVDRLARGALGDAAGLGDSLFAVEELAFADSARGRSAVALDVAVYVRAEDERWAARAEDLLGRLARGGYGAKKSAGYGHFDLAGWQRFDTFDTAPAQANGFISLSSWVPAHGDPTDGFYTARVKYGKLGEELANAANPFKLPLIMLAAGSAFYASAPIRDWYGRLVEGIAPADPRVVQYGYAFAIPARLAPEGDDHDT